MQDHFHDDLFSEKLIDIAGDPVLLGSGRKVWLCLFREANCPFCNFRVYDLTHNYKDIADMNVDIVAVFKSSQDVILKFISNRSRPFRIVSDERGDVYQRLNVKESWWGKLKAMMFRMPRLLFGMRLTGIEGMKTGNLMPADILIDGNGKIVHRYFGKDAGDHIPMSAVAEFARQY